MADLSQEEWVEKLENDENAFILDVRTPEEFEQGQIPESTNLNIYLGQEFLEELEKLDKTRNYYVYCRSGQRSRQACAIMNSIGISNAYNLMGGILEWNGDIV
jgi:rhodanese-related sulfurtransferase